MADTFARYRNIVGTEADWSANNILIGDGEIAFQRESGVIKAKMGDGVQSFADLDWFIGNLWTSEGNVTYSVANGPVVIGSEGAPAIDRLTVIGGNHGIGVYRETIPVDDQVLGIIKFGAWDAPEVEKVGATIRGFAVGTWSPSDHGCGIEFVVTPSGGTSLDIAMILHDDSSLEVQGDRIRLNTSKTPASATDTGLQGEICWDADYVYVCVQSGQ